ncbi:hypothetical protein B0T24DRAFT_661591 [Lasiosphaeria ovina]|uniref:Uncharacterized protein n=1 Tax=Lasiosphaeria ovina TaxID=92902 RepID=A0AAE0NK76_9PEZI|nr:hypothetical protein B0T24DRAFT_661591 [Lasiosphaeria ovina]
MSSWVDDYVGENCPEAFIDDLSRDGFGFVLKVLREIKTSWKLFLNEMERFLEDLVRPSSSPEFDDEALIASANWLHRKLILMIDYSERQLSYHSRFITYLTNAPSQHGLCIHPQTFERDLLQEKDAMVAVCSRFSALRTRTSAILDTAMNLHAVKQARFSQNMMELQRKDAELAFNQNQSMRRLTVLNMVYLPATFIAISVIELSTW